MIIYNNFKAAARIMFNWMLILMDVLHKHDGM